MLTLFDESITAQALKVLADHQEIWPFHEPGGGASVPTFQTAGLRVLLGSASFCQAEFGL
jgi:hypothetical protein